MILKKSKNLKNEKLQKRKLKIKEKVEIAAFMSINPKLSCKRVAYIFTEKFDLPIGPLTVYLVKVFLDPFSA